jgi:hypothetical protein
MAVLDEPGDALGQHGGFARPSARDHQHGPMHMLDSEPLTRVEDDGFCGFRHSAAETPGAGHYLGLRIGAAMRKSA